MKNLLSSTFYLTVFITLTISFAWSMWENSMGIWWFAVVALFMFLALFFSIYDLIEYIKDEFKDKTK